MSLIQSFHTFYDNLKFWFNERLDTSSFSKGISLPIVVYLTSKFALRFYRNYINKILFLPSNPFKTFLGDKSYSIIFNFDNEFAKSISEELARSRRNLILIGSSLKELSNFASMLKKKYLIDIILIDSNLDSSAIVEEMPEIYKKIENFDIGMVFILSENYESYDDMNNIRQNVKITNINNFAPIEFISCFENIALSRKNKNFAIVNLNFYPEIKNDLFSNAIWLKRRFFFKKFYKSKKICTLDINYKMSVTFNKRKVEDIVKDHFRNNLCLIGRTDKITYR